MKEPHAGFTLIEVMIAVVILSVGIIALVGSSSLVTRMIGQGKRSSAAVQVAASRLEKLRGVSRSTSPLCQDPAFASGGPITTRGVAESWVVPATGTSRTVLAIVTYSRVGGTVTDTLLTVVRCF
jgi:prepilin-type N-terminal cleavage/methylation domain-containing protein